MFQKEMILKTEISAEIISRLEKFVKDFPDSKRKNRFVLEIIKFYSEQENNDKMFHFTEKLSLDETIDEYEFYRSKLDLAEFYYHVEEVSNRFITNPTDSNFKMVTKKSIYRQLFNKLPIFSLSVSQSFSSGAESLRR